ncbi:glycosyltransferase [Listeria seeligeri]|uniref:glycosyltransferase n=1 Tax=Listeria seeligeri TaxID=1640 RepID=UPI0016276357|nr:glycosyltransferase [Listeria seeligeri]MBC1481478.1 glycosyltransferase [Listeria seeligeri]MBC1720476.1 glycosyltransferase [Listeria seeligeri]MBC1734145.1 glycosyltransferase [Listeria seeligeri]MBC1791582.1 glycosyltransferase [Listeria seeligeri]MBC1857697.1 glycosyltransferase [Listeria seeligeri]
MAIYHINKGIGWASSGVEYAQKYRSDIFIQAGMEQHFVFTDYLGTNLIHFTSLLGLRREEVIGIYSYMAGQENHVSSYPIHSFEQQLQGDFSLKEEEGAVLYEMVQENVAYRVWTIEQKYVDRVDYLVNGKLVAADHYSDRLTNTEYYQNGQLVSRTFFSETGEVTLQQFYQNKAITLTRWKNQVLIGRNAFFQAFFKQLSWSKSDVVLIDRNLNVADAVLPQLQGAKVGVIIHAEHYNLNYSEANWVLWNNHYEYVFTNAAIIDWFITATEAQAKKLAEHFQMMHQDTTKIHAIPVGCMDGIMISDIKKNRCKLMTASRLATEKHIDILIQAVALVKERFPLVTLDIYGEGGCKGELEKLIKELQAENFIKLKGHHSMGDKYAQYGAYLSASYSEGFGLTLLEAVNFGLPIVGFDVPYGNPTFINSGVNGFLVKKGADVENVASMAEAIQKLLAPSFDFRKATTYAHEKAAGYTIKEVGDLWKRLFDFPQKEGKV